MLSGIVLMLLTTSTVFGQQFKDNERIRAMRVAFITNALELTPEESQGFWALYNEYESSQRSIRAKYRSNRNMMLMNDKELEQQIENTLDMEGELLQLKRTYIGRLKDVIPIRKIAMLNNVEKNFREELLKEFRQRQRTNAGKND